MALNEKQIRFCEEYLIDLNGTQAAIRAGYSQKTANVIAAQNLAKLNIQAYLRERRLQVASELNITQDRVLKEYARIAFSDIRKFYDENGRLKSIHELDDDSAHALAGLEVDELWALGIDGKKQVGDTKKIKIWDKVKSLDSLGKHLGLFEVSSSLTGKKITVTISD